MTSVLYLPDGNRRYAKREGISIAESYKQGSETFGMCCDFFLVGNRSDTMIWYAMGKHTHERTDGSPKLIYDALDHMLRKLVVAEHLRQNGINFEMIDYSRRLPTEINDLAMKLTSSNDTRNTKKAVLLTGYAQEDDMDSALRESPSSYNGLRKGLAISEDISLVIRPGVDDDSKGHVMPFSSGPTYAMSNAYMVRVSKHNPEMTEEDLKVVWEDFLKTQRKRRENNPTTL